jgi:hypothetical protein
MAGSAAVWQLPSVRKLFIALECLEKDAKLGVTLQPARKARKQD